MRSKATFKVGSVDMVDVVYYQYITKYYKIKNTN